MRRRFPPPRPPVWLPGAAALLFLLSSAQAGHLVRYQYWDSFDGLGARTTSYQTFIAETYTFMAGFWSDNNVMTVAAATPVNLREDYGSVIRGYVVAPQDGAYTFTIASDDSSGFWLSANHTVPANFPSQNPTQYRAPDAEESAYSSAGIFGSLRLAERTTAPVTLTRGQTLYFEMFSQEGGGGDFMQIGWTRPDGVQEIIPADYLIPWEPAGTPLTLANGEAIGFGTDPRPVSGPRNTTVPERGTATLTVDIFGGQAPCTFQWRENGAPLAGATLPALTLSEVGLDRNGRRYDCVITDAAGASRTSAQATLTVQPDTQGPRIVSARGSGNPHGILITFDEPVDPATAGDVANYAFTGQAVTVGQATLHAPNQVLLTVSDFTTAPLTLTVNNVTDLSAARNPILPNSQAGIHPVSTLAGYWPLDEGGGTHTADLASGQHGTLMNDPTWVTDAPALGGRPNPFAIQFDGVNDYVQTTHPGIGGSAARTVSFWIKAGPDSLNTHGLVAWGNSTQSSTKYHVRLEPTTGSLRTEAQGGNSWATTRLNDEVWHHVVSLLPEGGDNFAVQHYVDGVLDPRLGGANVAVNTDITSANAIRLRIGARDQTGSLNAFPGLLDDVALFAAALTPEQIAQLAQGTSPLSLGAPLAGPLSFTEQPVSRTVQQLRPVTFSALATGSPVQMIGYQWFRDEVAIPGATGTALTLEETSLADHGAVFHIEAFNADGTFARIRSNAAVLSVVDDQDPPALLAIAALSDPVNRIDLLFDEPLDPATATDPANYSVAGATVLAAVLGADARTVRLSTSPLTEDQVYVVEISGVTDPVGNALNRSTQVTAAMTYTELVLSDGPTAYWPLDDLEGTAVRNLANPAWNGSLNSGTSGALPILGLPGIVPNLAGRAIGFAAAQGNRILIPDHATLNVGGPYQFKTVELWFRTQTLPVRLAGGTPERMFLFEQGGTTRGISLYLSGTQPANPNTAEIHFHAWNRGADGVGAPWGGPEAAGLNPVIVIGTVEQGKTYHAVLVLEGDNAGTSGRLIGYLNGVAVGSAPGVGLLYNHGDDAGIGAINQNAVVKESDRSVGYGDPFDGLIDEVALYNQALTAAQVAAHYNQGVKPGPVPTVEAIFPGPGAVNVDAGSGLELVLRNQATAVDPASLALRLNGVTVTPQITQAGDLTTARYTAPSYPSRTLMTVEAAWLNNAGVQGGFTWTFTSIAVLPASWAAPVGSGVDRGFRARSSQAAPTPTLANTLARAEAQLATPPTPAAVFTGAANLDVVNLSHWDGFDNGYFTFENGFQDADFSNAGLVDPTGMNTNNFAIEILTYLDLQPGIVRLGINSDDGFRLTAGRVPADNTLILAEFNGGRAITTATPQSPALFRVTQAGVYAFRLVYFQGDVAAGLEWQVQDAAGNSHLLNAPSSPIRAYRSRNQDPPRVTHPTTLAVATDGTSVTLVFATESGGTYEVQASPALRPAAWTPLRTVVGDGTPASISEPLTGDTRFFRVESK